MNITWEKQNLVTLPGGYDIWRCSACGLKKKYYGLRRDLVCPQCGGYGKDKKSIPVYGCWGNLDLDHWCIHCKKQMILCPKEGHKNSHLWSFQRTDSEGLFVCPNGCLEDGSYVWKEGDIVFKRGK